MHLTLATPFLTHLKAVRSVKTTFPAFVRLPYTPFCETLMASSIPVDTSMNRFSDVHSAPISGMGKMCEGKCPAYSWPQRKGRYTKMHGCRRALARRPLKQTFSHWSLRAVTSKQAERTSFFMGSDSSFSGRLEMHWLMWRMTARLRQYSHLTFIRPPLSPCSSDRIHESALI
jgi:hypothetical protein